MADLALREKPPGAPFGAVLGSGHRHEHLDPAAAVGVVGGLAQVALMARPLLGPLVPGVPGEGDRGIAAGVRPSLFMPPTLVYEG